MPIAAAKASKIGYHVMAAITDVIQIKLMTGHMLRSWLAVYKRNQRTSSAAIYVYSETISGSGPT